MLYWIYLPILEHIRTSTGYHVLLDIPSHTWKHSNFYWILCSTGYTFPYLNTFVLLLNIIIYWINLSILEHIRTSTGYYALPDIPFHNSTHSYFYWISFSTGYTLPYLKIFVLLLDIILYWIYLSILEHIRTSTGYHVLLDIPFHAWTHSHFYWISCSTGYTLPYLITLALLLDITLYRIYLSILEHIRTSTGYHFLLDIPCHTWIRSHRNT